VGGALAWWARQPLILGYVLGGLLVSPFTPGPSVSDVHTFDLFAEIGVVLLMFSIGIEFSIRDLVRVRWVALLGAPLGIILCAGLGLAGAAVLGWPTTEGLVIGAVISVASTMVLGRLLLDRGELHSRHGRVMMGITLVQDLAVVVLIVLIPVLDVGASARSLTIAMAVGKALVILVPFVILAAKVIPPLMTRVARTRNEELFLLVALAIGLGTAAITEAAGLSLALGAFLAGVIISESDYSHEALARLLPLREAFGALFFVTVGALIDPAAIQGNWATLAVLVVLVVVGKLVVSTLVVRLFGESLHTALLVGVGLGQIGEFSFVLVQVARNSGKVDAGVYNVVLATSLITILINALLVRAVPTWLGRRRVSRATGGAGEPPEERLAEHVVLCGFGRVGSAIGEALETFGIHHVVIELDPDVVTGLRARRVPCLFGDAANRRILEHAGAQRAALVVVALPEMDRARLVIRHVRGLSASVPILARAHHPSASEELARAGATEVIQPEMEAAATLIRHALRRLSLPHEPVLAYLDRFREAMEPADRPPAPASDTLPRVADVAIGQGPLADLSLREARIRERLGVTVVAIIRRRDGTDLNPSPDAILRSGDRVRLFGLPDQIEAFRAEAE
jgi:K+:H+ antiporter